MNSRPTIVVLAAGLGSRFEGPAHKLDQPLGESSVLGTTLRNAIASHLPLVVVISAALAAQAALWVAPHDIVVLPDGNVPFGMGHSIAAGVAARANAPGWLLLPADMPLVQPTTLLAVAAGLVHHPVAYAQYNGRRGHPVGFAAELYSELMLLSGDDGARRIVARYPAVGVDVDDPGVLVDVDTADDLAQVRAADVVQQARPAAAD